MEERSRWRWLRWRNWILPVIGIACVCYGWTALRPFFAAPEVVFDDNVPEEVRGLFVAHLDELKPGWKRHRIPFGLDELRTVLADGAEWSNRVRISRSGEFLVSGDANPADGFYNACFSSEILSAPEPSATGLVRRHVHTTLETVFFDQDGNKYDYVFKKRGGFRPTLQKVSTGG